MRLEPFIQPPPVTAVACAACGAFVAECLAPVGEGSRPCCWHCAHQIADHGAALEEAPGLACDCSPAAIFPAHVLERRQMPKGCGTCGAVARHTAACLAEL